ncbi:hypothetical protein GN156_31805, partial [bacterium LRH843]|nr:hypothetical protein [bacterium LRH843]
AANEAMQAEQEAEGTATSTSEDLAHESLERVTQLINQKAHSLNLYVYEDVPEAEADAHTHGEADDEYDEEVDEYAEAETEETETEES